MRKAPSIENPCRVPVALLVLLLACGCGEDTLPSAAERTLCQGRTGFAARITGAQTPVALCIPDDSLVQDVDLGARVAYDRRSERYTIEAGCELDSVTYAFSISFRRRPDTPVSLRLTGDFAEALASPDIAWLGYEELGPDKRALRAASVSGFLRITFNDAKIAVGTFSQVAIALEDSATQEPAGKRILAKGFLNVSVDV